MLNGYGKTPRDEKHLAFVRAMPCCSTGSSHNVVAHHVRLPGFGGGTGLKPSDYRTVPLTWDEHGKLHQMGEKSFWRSLKLDPTEIIIEILQARLVKIRGHLVTLEGKSEMSPREHMEFLENRVIVLLMQQLGG